MNRLDLASASEVFPAEASWLLDAAWFVSAVQEAIGVVPKNAAPRWLRISPGRRAAVLYDVTLGRRRTVAVVSHTAGFNPAAIASSAEAIRVAAGARDGCASPQPFHALPGEALVEWYPAAIDLPGLAAAAGRMSDFDPTGLHGPPVLAVYRPKQRAVLRAGGIYLKAYASSMRFDRALEGLALASRIRGLRAPELLAAFPGERLTFQRSLEGRRVVDTPAAREKLGEALARLHGSKLMPSRFVGTLDHLAAAGKAGRRTAALLPGLASRIDALLDRLTSTLPSDDSFVLAHGDFHDRQALVHDGAVALLDFDAVMETNAAFDFARFGAHGLGGREGIDRALRRIEDLATGYGRRPAALEWFLSVAVLRRALHPLRVLHPGWAQQASKIVDAAEELAR